jgi:hypothetical protein
VAEPVEEVGIILADGHQVLVIRWQLLEDRKGALEERLGLGAIVGV